MSDKKRRMRLAMRACEQFYRDPGRDTLYVAFKARHGAMARRYGADVMRWSYRLHLAQVGIDPSVIIRIGDLTVRRV